MPTGHHPSQAHHDLSLRQLRWQCRRGLLELDLLLGHFLETQYPQLSSAKKAEFVTLLQYPDQVLLQWFTDQATPPDALQAISTAVKNCLQTP